MSIEKQSRVLLQGDTLHIGFYRIGKTPYPEDVVSSGVLRAVAQHLQVDLETSGVFWGDYCFFAGVTGEAFRFLEFMGLVTDDVDRPLVERYGHMPVEEMYRCAFDAAGITADFYGRPNLPGKATVRDMIVDSIGNRQTPVIGFGVFGPPEPFLITGYDDGGDTICGFSHFQEEKKNDSNLSFEDSGQFRLEEWYDSISGIIVVSGTKERPDAGKIYLDALKRALLEIRSPGDLGIPAMERWALYLEDDRKFAEYSDTQLEKANSDHGGTAGDLAERRALAASFLELAQRFLPEAEHELERAKAAFQGMHDTVYEIWETVAKGGPFDPDLEKFKDPELRRTMASLVRRLARLDERGAMFIQCAVDRIEGRDPSEIAADPLLDGRVELTKASSAAASDVFFAPENIALPNQLCMLQSFLGELFEVTSESERANRKLDYSLWMGFSGAAFGLLSDGPERSNLPLVFDALGYDYELWMSAAQASEAEYPCRIWGWDDNLRRRIFWNLRDRRLPVLLFNWGTWPDWRLVTAAENWWSFRGYGGNNGEVYRPNEPLDHPKNPLRPIELFDGMSNDKTWTINILAKRSTARPSMEELYERAITWGARKMKQQTMRLLDDGGNEFVSTEPYQDWARMLRTESLFPSDDVNTLKKRRSSFDGDEVELAERRFYGAGFLECAAERLGRPELKTAATHFRAVLTLMQRIWELCGGLNSPESHLEFGKSATREAIADLLLEIEREDKAAAALLAGSAG